MKQSTIQARLPRTFYEDHRDRDLPSGTPKKWLKNQVDVELTFDEWKELLSDARFYADPDMGFAKNDPYLKGIVSSATKTVKRLEMYGPGDFN